MKEGIDSTAYNNEQGNRARKLFAAVVLAALDDAIADDKKFGNGPDQIARWAPQPFVPLGTDGFGLSDARRALRRHFEVDAAHVVVAALHALAQRGDIKAEVVTDAICRYGIDPDASDPRDA